MTEYKRCQGKSYMICEEKSKQESFELPMLTRNTIPGLLPLQIIYTEEGMQYWYEISGRHDLENWSEVHRMGSGFLKKFITALQQTMQNAGEYLLSEDGISLEPGRIFLEYEEKEILFCYTPFEKKAFSCAIREFMEYFLQHMEHGSQEEIQKCYAVYDRCQEEHVSLPEILEVLMEEEIIEEGENSEDVKTAEPEMSFRKSGEDEKKRFSLLLPEWNLKSMMRRKRKTYDMSYAFAPEEQSSQSSNPTIFLGSETGSILGELRYEGDGREENLFIKQPVFLIGNQKEEVDGMIHASTVSRIHAKIMREGEDYYLEDMNSTNGTFRNGELLNYREKVLLKKNDVIKFAEEAYRFV